MQINPQNTTPNFGAKFLYSDSLKQIADYAKSKGQYQKLNQARLNIAEKNKDARILVDIGLVSKLGKEGTKPFVEFSVFNPINNAQNNTQNKKLFELKRKISFEAPKDMDPIKFAYNKILGLGKKDINNKIYKRILPD